MDIPYFYTIFVIVVFTQVLCKSFPCEFVNYLNYCRSLRFEDRPDYAYLRRFVDVDFSEQNIFTFYFQISKGPVLP